jgi:hypothetical protein
MLDSVPARSGMMQRWQLKAKSNTRRIVNDDE